MGIKYTINQISSGEDELMLNYTSKTPEIETIIQFMNSRQKRLVGKIDDENVVINPDDILYAEVVDDKTFVYTIDQVVRINMGLTSLTELLHDVKYFRCSKSMMVNINKVEKLKSLSSNRIDAIMQGGEHILISRTYASDFRRILRGE